MYFSGIGCDYYQCDFTSHIWPDQGKRVSGHQKLSLFVYLKMLHFDENPMEIGYLVMKLWLIYVENNIYKQKNLSSFFANISNQYMTSDSFLLIMASHMCTDQVIWVILLLEYQQRTCSNYFVLNFIMFSAFIKCSWLCKLGLHQNIE